MYLGPNRFGGQVNGTSNQRRYERKYLNYEWIEMSVLDWEFYKQLASAVLTSQYYNDMNAFPVEAAVLSAKHYWATKSSTEKTQEILEDATGIPPMPQVPTYSLRHLPPALIILMVLGLSRLLLSLTMRSQSGVATNYRRFPRLLRLVNLSATVLAIVVAYRLELWWDVRHSRLVLGFSYGLLLVGLMLHWYSTIHRRRFLAANPEGHGLVESGPYRLVRHPVYAGSLLTSLALALSFEIWESFLIVLLPCCVVTLWCIHVEEQALTDALGDAYRDYARRTKRLIPLIY